MVDSTENYRFDLGVKWFIGHNYLLKQKWLLVDISKLGISEVNINP